MPWVKYDPTYPLTKPKSNIVDHRTVYKIAVIADPDQASVRDGTKKLFSELLTGLDSFGLWWVRSRTVIISNLDLISRIYGESIKGTLSLQGDKVEVIFGNDSIELESDYSFSGRGMELSVTGLLVVTKCVGDNHCNSLSCNKASKFSVTKSMMSATWMLSFSCNEKTFPKIFKFMMVF